MWIDSRFSRTGCRGLQIDPLLSDKMVPDCSKLPSAPESFLNQGIRSPWELTRTQISGLLPKPTMGLPDGDHESAFQRVSTGLERERDWESRHVMSGVTGPWSRKLLVSIMNSQRGQYCPQGGQNWFLGGGSGWKNLTLSIKYRSIYSA